VPEYPEGQVTDRKPPFRYSAVARVWFSDTDAQGVVYYGRYMPYFDHARTEYHRHLGLRQGSELSIAMRAMSVEYAAPARFDDLLEVFIRVAALGTTSVTFELAAYRVGDDALMCTALQTSVFIDAQRRKREVPPEYRATVERFEGGRPLRSA
jgi:acyl-CoA thioester hydrolase